MIPKVIHYCWFGNKEISDKEKNFIKEWKELNPEFEIKKWDETNFDVNMCKYTQDAYNDKNYALVSDIARLWIIYNYGGIYLDTDIQLIKPFDNELLNNKSFFSLEAFYYPEEKKTRISNISTGLGFGAEPFSKAVKFILDKSCERPYVKKYATINYIIDDLKEYGLKPINEKQYLKDLEMTIYPCEYFNSYIRGLGLVNKTKNTYTIHWYHHNR